MKIGVFDSGIGGLTVLKELVARYPAEYIYIGDSLRAPYGNKTKEELLSHTKELLQFLQKKNCGIFVSACNSLSSLEVEPLLQEIGIARENYKDMISSTENGVHKDIQEDSKVLLYATVATIRSGAYQEVFKEHDIISLPSVGLASAIERAHQIEIDEEVDLLVDQIIVDRSTHLFLGCTHFPLITEYLEKRLHGLPVQILNPAKYIVATLPTNPGSKNSLALYTTKQHDGWREAGKAFEGISVEEVSLTE